MPRTGPIGQFTLPGAQKTQQPNTVIPSAVNNQGWADIEQTFNTPQPIAYGGTNAQTEAQARENLGLEIGVDIPSNAQLADVSAKSAMNSRPSIIVNGSMIDSQENGNTLGTTNGYFAADQFALYFTAATAAMSIQRVQSSRSLAGSRNKLEFKTTTAKTVLAATDFVMISQPIEGSRPDFVAAGWGAAGAKPFMYRVDQQLPAGLYHIHAQNSAGNRHIAVPFTATGSEAVIEVAIPGDTSGTWLTGDGVIGVVIDIVLAAGSSRTGGTASTWSGSTFYAASTQKNILDSTSNIARVTDVGLRLDPDATGVYGQYEVGEVDAVYRSERYWEKSYDPTVAPGTATSIGAESCMSVDTTGVNKSVSWLLKSKTPAVTVYSTSGAAGFIRNVNAGSDQPSSVTNVSQRGYIEAGGTTTTRNYQWQWTANARLT